MIDRESHDMKMSLMRKEQKESSLPSMTPSVIYAKCFSIFVREHCCYKGFVNHSLGLVGEYFGLGFMLVL